MYLLVITPSSTLDEGDADDPVNEKIEKTQDNIIGAIQKVGKDTKKLGKAYKKKKEIKKLMKGNKKEEDQMSVKELLKEKAEKKLRK